MRDWPVTAQAMGRPDWNIVRDKVVFVHAIRVCGGADRYLHLVLTSALVEVSGEFHNPTALPIPGKELPIPIVGPRDSGVPRNFVRGRGGSTNSLEDRGQREQGSGGGSPLVRGSGGSCNWVQ